ncbi:MAG: peroxiredoxin [Myxococcales bacterium]|nr:peroxiredoxin [Myxococcales bacterium]MCB9748566.1 peroxiredoxin [Myxococcales bacterium]
MLEIGAQAPSFTLLDTAREERTLADFRGRPLVIAFFPAAFTGVCEKELCTFRDSLAGLNEVGAAVVAISVDAPFANAAFVERNNLNFAVLSDYRRDAVRAYGVAHDDFAGMQGYTAAKRSVFVVSGEGKIAYAWIAPNPGVEPDYDAVGQAVRALESSSAS